MKLLLESSRACSRGATASRSSRNHLDIRDVSYIVRVRLTSSASLLRSSAHRRYESNGGPVVELRHQGNDGSLDAPIEVAVYRIVQEALTNIVRHSKARRAAIDILIADGSLTIHIEDDGDGFHWDGNGSGAGGLRGMKERVRMLDGVFNISTAAGRERIWNILPLGRDGSSLSRW